MKKKLKKDSLSNRYKIFQIPIKNIIIIIENNMT